MLPPTTEKVIDTHVRTAAGAPIVIGGLIERDSEEQVDKLPGLGSLPLLGMAFQRRVESLQHTDLEVYILPHVEYPAGAGRTAWTFRDFYERFVARSGE
jgi:type II secretory pathway component GspD/PulD (secretin)